MMACPTVLIADDDDYIRNVIVALVKQVLPASHVATFENGKDALEYYRQYGADLVVSNFMMPEMDGPAFVSLLRKCDRGLPIIMVSSSPDAEKLGQEAGIDCFVDKFGISKRLPAAIRSLLDEGRFPPVRYPRAA
ncbi:MAG: response regulator [Chthoniobacteraceae bacterium]